MSNSQKIFMLGLQGSGKTTLSETLSKHLEIPVYHIDKILFDSNWKVKPLDKIANEIKQVCDTDKWIFDGCYSQCSELINSNADLCIIITSGRVLSYFNIFKRRLMSINCPRVGTPEGSNNKLYLSLLKKVWLRNNKKEAKRREELQAQNSTLKFVTIKRVNKKAIFKIIKKLNAE